jgi:mannosyl-glycoprotein endo-beta-N-acetylglucosaminidase
MLPSAAEVSDGNTAAAGDDRRAWEPPFDASSPAPPISYPITDLAALASRAYLSAEANFHLPFNRASVPAPASPLPQRRRVLVCHDMQGGYRDDAAPQGGANPDAYALWHWHLVDVFVYFSHYLVTLPPPCWINAAHIHGVKVFALFLPRPLRFLTQSAHLSLLFFSLSLLSVCQGFRDVHHRVG